MKIGFVLQDRTAAPSGLDVYTRNLWRALRELGTAHEFVPTTVPAAFAARAYLRALWEQAYLPAWARRQRLDLLHVPAGSAPLLSGAPCVLTLHDLGDAPRAGYRTPLGPRLFFGRLVPWSARRAAAVITDSLATKAAAIARLGIPPERISVVRLAAAPAFRPLPREAVTDVLRRYEIASRYFLCVGAIIPRKNVTGALEGFARFRARSGQAVQFVIAGARGFGDLAPPPAAQRLIDARAVRFLGHVPEDDLAALYSGALALVLTSFHEGFGLPLVEAFACGTPAIASDVASLPEVGGDAALYVDPRDPESIASAMERYAGSAAFRAEMAGRAATRSRRFDWRRTAQETLAVYERAGESVSASGRRSIAMETPSPRVLFVRLDSLGDLVLTTPCFAAVKQRFPAARVEVAVQPEWAPLAEADPNVDGVHTLRPPWRSGWQAGAARETIALLRRLRRERYDWVIVPRRDFDDALFGRLCGGRHTLGFAARRTRAVLTSAVRFDQTLHVAQNHLRLLEPLGCETDAGWPAVFCMSGRPERIEQLLAGAKSDGTLVAFAPFAASGPKSLSPRRAAELVDVLAASIDGSIVLIGGPSDRDQADLLLWRRTREVIDLVGRTSLAELCDVLRRCRLLVGVDSGPMHLAAALSVPVVGLFAGEDPRLWHPYGPAPHRVLSARDARGRASADAIASDEVVAAAVELLEEAAAASPGRLEAAS